VSDTRGFETTYRVNREKHLSQAQMKDSRFSREVTRALTSAAADKMNVSKNKVPQDSELTPKQKICTGCAPENVSTVQTVGATP
jgi:hypothetical protein